MLKTRIDKEKTIYCSGLFLSARWFIISEAAPEGINLVILPDKESAEYCTSDLYNLIEGDRVFLLPPNGKNIERSNYKSSISVQRTAAINAVLKNKGEKVFIICCADALEERISFSGRRSGKLTKSDMAGKEEPQGTETPGEETARQKQEVEHED